MLDAESIACPINSPKGLEIRRFLKFAAISGTGWLADFTLLLLLVRFIGMPAFSANLVSSSLAALSVFLISRHLVFDRAAGALPQRIALYFGYNLALIFLASLAVGMLAPWLALLASRLNLDASATMIAAAAKVLVTPPQLLMNFLASRFLSETGLAAQRHD